jgi:hypothetical protein
MEFKFPVPCTMHTPANNTVCLPKQDFKINDLGKNTQLCDSMRVKCAFSFWRGKYVRPGLPDK